MTATVKQSNEISIVAPTERYSYMAAGRPVRGSDWLRMADVANSLASMPYQRVPTTLIGQSVGTGGSVDLVFRSRSHGVALARVWIVQMQDPLGLDIILTINGTGFRYNRGPTEAHVVEMQTLSDASDEITLTVANSASSDIAAQILFVSCYEMPRGELRLDSSDYGVDQGTVSSGKAIIDQGIGESVRGVERAVVQLEDRCRRNVLQWATTSTGVLGVSSTDETTFQELTDIVDPVALAYALEDETTRSLEVWVYASGNGEVRITESSSSNTVTLTFASGSYVWDSDTLSIDAEDLTADGGLRASAHDLLTIEYRSTDDNAFGVRGVSLVAA